MAEVKKTEDWSANVKAVLFVNVLEIFTVILLVDRSINVLMSEELEDKR